jgi:hypothetical protein
MITLFVLAISISVFAQETSPAPKWEIAFGRAWGRVHENSIRQTVNSDGRITFLNKKNGTPAVSRITENEIDEITGLINRLNLPQAKAIPANEFNNCIVSPHLPNVYFSLTLNNREYYLTHCNNSGDKNRKYEYTLNLSVAQKALYKRLREKLESLKGEESKPGKTSNSQ